MRHDSKGSQQEVIPITVCFFMFSSFLNISFIGVYIYIYTYIYIYMCESSPFFVLRRILLKFTDECLDVRKIVQKTWD